MQSDQRAQYQALLQQLSGLVQSNPKLALVKIQDLLRQRPNDANFLHLKGLAASKTGQHNEAIEAMRASLESHSHQPEVHNNLANSYRALGRNEEAEKHYRDAVALHPDYIDALKNLGLLLHSTGDLSDAREFLQRAVYLSGNTANIVTALGNVLREQELFDEAISCYQTALRTNPDYVNAIHNLGLCHKLNEDPENARACFTRAAELAPQFAEIDVSLGNIAFELKDYSTAEKHFESALRKEPGYVLAHESLSELRWQLGKEDSYTDSYHTALEQRPSDMPLRHSLLRLLINSQRFDAARELVNQSIKSHRTPELLRASGELYANEQDFVHARENFEEAIKLSPSTEVTHDLVKLLLLEADYAKALSLLDSLLLTEPNNQLTWALRGTAWRLLGDERYQWLINYDRDIKVSTLSTPSGYRSLDEFLQHLQDVLLSMHTTQAAPMRQTLVGGTQTPGRLLHKPHPVIQLYREALSEVINDYILQMPVDNKHPLFSRKSSAFEFSGSWSVKLLSSGYHVNHVHPEGWISSACYIHLPSTMDDQSSVAGCIKFGESSLNLGEREVIEKVVRPLPGQLALFPSYAWHGTFDFECADKDYRLTAPFDVKPL
ncbi:MAG: tetratricopeptide repeat protein [Halioglobus sp.]